MNKLTPDGQAVIDANGKAWALETAHPMPLPKDITSTRHIECLCWNKVTNRWVTLGGVLDTGSSCYTHWLLRTEPPAPKTQEQLDEEAFLEWRKRLGATKIAAEADMWAYHEATDRNVWHAALAYERGKEQP